MTDRTRPRPLRILAAIVLIACAILLAPIVLAVALANASRSGAAR